MFRVQIETTNAALSGEYGGDDVETTARFDERNAELARILRDMADQIETGSAPTSWTIRDVNGNTVGKAGFGR